MRRLKKIATIATFEFLTAVKRPGYLIATFGMPLFVAAYGAIVAIPAYYIEMREKAASLYGVVDQGEVLGLTGDVSAPRTEIPEDVRRAVDALGQSRALDDAIGPSQFHFRPFVSETEARAALTAGTLKGYFVLPADYLASGVVEAYSGEASGFSGGEGRQAFGNLVRERLLAGRTDAALAARVLKPLEDMRRLTVTRSGEVADGGQAASMVRLAIPLVFTILFLVSVLMTSGYLMQGTATEKENKVVEVLLASANPDQILAGKLVGLGGAGLLQIGVWLIMALGTGLGLVPLLIAADVPIPWSAVLLAIPLFLVAFLFFGSLMLGTGSLGSNMRESQQLAMVWSLTAALPLILIGVLLQEPHGVVARVLTWIPFSAGQVIVMRASLDPGALAWWEVVGAFVVLVVSTWLAIGLGARLFRIGLLSTGSRPGLREILRQARLA